MPRSPYRFYFPAAIEEGARVLALPEGESHHLFHVLRLGAGEEVRVFDSQGGLWRGEVAGKDGKQARIALAEKLETAREEHSRVMIATSLLKRRAMDWMIEKLTELDVASLQPLVCKRTVIQQSETKGHEPPARWERISLAAAKQSGRAAPMSFYPITPLAAWLARERPRVLTCVAHNAPGAISLGEWLGARAGMNLPVMVAVGPEGGWTPGEIEAFQSAGIQAVTLGPLILRAETAALTVAAACRVML